MIVNKSLNSEFAWKYQRYTDFSAGIRDEVKSFMVFVSICSKLKCDILPTKTTLHGVVINSELVVLPIKLCCIRTSTRDLK